MKIVNEEYDSRLTVKDVLPIKIRKISKLIRGYVTFHKKHLFIGKHGDFFCRKRICFLGKAYIGDYVEIDGLSSEGIVFGEDTSIGKGTIIRGTGSLDLLGKGMKTGNHFGCGDYCFFGCAGGISIGDNVIMGQQVRFHAQNHCFDDWEKPIREQGTTEKGIIVEDDVWIGAGSVILDGVIIGKGAVIGANTLVNKDVPAYSLVAGNPMRMIRQREKKKTGCEYNES